MWLRLAKIKIAGRYDVNNRMLRDYLQDRRELIRYAPLVMRFLDSEGYNSEGENQNETVKNWIEGANQEDIERCLRYIMPKRRLGFSREIDPRNPEWLMHVTLEDAADNIEQNGFEYGHPWFEDLAYTGGLGEHLKTPGYNYAYLASGDDWKKSWDKFGGDILFFKAPGTVAIHSGDKEEQVISWGEAIDPKDIFHVKIVWKDEQLIKYYSPKQVEHIEANLPALVIVDGGGKGRFISNDASKIAEWLEVNGPMIKRTKKEQSDVV